MFALMHSLSCIEPRLIDSLFFCYRFKKPGIIDRPREDEEDKVLTTILTSVVHSILELIEGNELFFSGS